MLRDVAAPRVRQLGGEMVAWTDWDPARAPGVPGGGVLQLVSGELSGPGRRVLVAGPHDAELVRALVAAGGEVDWLVRSLADAERLAEEVTTVAMLSGSVTALDETTYDVVVALDGLDRLSTAEDNGPGWADVLGLLSSRVRPGGTLVLAHENPLGVHRLVEIDPGPGLALDSEWYRPAGVATDRPASPAQAWARLADNGLLPVATYAGYPIPAEPTVLIGPRSVEPALAGALSVELSVALTDRYRGRPVLTDPRPLARRAQSAGAESTLAPVWIHVAHRPSGEPAAEAGPEHGVLIGELGSPAVDELLAVDGRVRRVPLVPGVEGLVRAGLRRAVPDVERTTPAGRPFDERLLELCARVDLVGLRAELARLADWVDDQATAGAVAGAEAMAVPARLLDDGVSFWPVARTWQPLEPVPAHVVLTRACWHFAVQLVTGASPHPWPLASSAADLLQVLLGMAGRACDRATLEAAIDLQVAADCAEEGLSSYDEQARRLAYRSVEPGAVPADVAGYEQLTEALWRQRYQVSHLMASSAWTEEMIRSRDRALSQLDWEIQFARASAIGRVGVLTREAYRAMRTDARKAYRRFRAAAKRSRARRARRAET